MKILLHPAVWSQLERVEAHPTGSYLFVGEEGSGRKMATLELARRLNCQHITPEPCTSCRQFASGNHPDLLVVSAGDKLSIGIEQIRGLKSDLSLSRYRSTGYRIVIIEAADRLTGEAQNAMLKLMEEPPEATIIVLIARSTDRLLPTVRSRCQTIVMSLPTENEFKLWLADSLNLSGEQLARIERQADRLAGRAVRLAREPDLLLQAERFDEMASKLVSQSLFDRLISLRQLSEEKVALREILSRLQRIVHELLRSGQDATRQLARLEALETCYRRLDANVTPRLALEALVIEFS